MSGDRRRDTAWERWERHGEDPSRVGREWDTHQVEGRPGVDANVPEGRMGHRPGNRMGGGRDADPYRGDDRPGYAGGAFAPPRRDRSWDDRNRPDSDRPDRNRQDQRMHDRDTHDRDWQDRNRQYEQRQRAAGQSTSGYRGPRGQGYGGGDLHRRWDEEEQYGQDYGYGRGGMRGQPQEHGPEYGYGHAGRDEEWRDRRGRAGNWRLESEDDFGSRAGGGRYGPRGGSYGARGRDQDRGLWDRASDEVASWFGDDDAEQRRQRDEQRDRRFHRGPGGEW